MCCAHVRQPACLPHGAADMGGLKLPRQPEERQGRSGGGSPVEATRQGQWDG